MKPSEVALATVGLVALGLSAWALKENFPPRREETVFTSGCQFQMTVLGRNDAPSQAVLFHGLTANRRTMLLLGVSLAGSMQVFLLDHPGHGDSTQPFNYDQADSCAAKAVEWLEREKRIRLETTVLIGHSMGAGIVIRLADQFPAAATISISTAFRKPVVGNLPALAPLELPRRLPVNLLLINAQYDLPELKEASRRMIRAAEGERYGPQDFAQRRAVQWVTISRATHTSLLFDAEVRNVIARWIGSAVPESNGSSRTLDGLHPFLISTGLLGLFFLYPLFASLVCGPKPSSVSHAQPSLSILRCALAWMTVALMAVLLQFNFVPLGPLVRMYSGDYLASVLMIVGVLLLILRRRWAQHAAPLQTNWNGRAVGVAAALGILTMLAWGAWLNWQITDAWLNAPRWWRFALLVPLVLPYFLAEEMALGAPQAKMTWPTKAGRYILFLGLRGLLWLAMLLGLLVLQSGEILKALLVMYLAAFSIAQRMGMDAVRRRTGSAAAAAVFGAILAAWFIAAVFPIT